MRHSIALALSLGLVACGGGSPPTNPPTTTTVGPAGGDVKVADGTVVTFPEGALAGPVNVSITPSAKPAPANAAGPVYDLSPADTALAKPITITLPYDPAKVPASSDVSVAISTVAAPSWTVLSPSVQPEPGQVEAPTISFGSFVAVLAPDQSALVSNENFPGPITVSGTTLVWVNQGSATAMVGKGQGFVMKLDLTNKAAGAVAVSAADEDPKAAVVVGDSVYWASGGHEAATPGGPTGAAIRKAPLAGGTATTVHADLGFPVALATDGTYLYWLDHDKKSVMKGRAMGGSAPTALATNQTKPKALVVQGGFVYWTAATDGTVMRAPADGSAAATAIASGQAEPTGLALDASYAYFTTMGDGAVKRVPLAGGAVTALSTGNNRPYAVATDGVTVYWSNHGDGSIRRASVTGTRKAVFAPAQSIVYGLALSADSLYWTSQGNGVNQGQVAGAAK